MATRRVKRLRKEDILQGKDRRETLYLDTYDAEVEIRPLTDGELTEIFSVLGNIPLTDEGNPDIALVDVMKNFQALRLAASRGLVDPALTVEDVAEMQFGTPELIGTRVLEISGVTSPDDAKKKGKQ